MTDHEHIHDENCTCGCHEHEHHDHHDHHEHAHHDHHHHDDNCTCGHDHHDHHHHDENCGCGHDHHDHDHHHHHHDGECDCDECRTRRVGECYEVSYQLHDEACVISGNCTVTGDYAAVSAELKKQLEGMAALINQQGGIIGHIKASAEVTSVDMFSVTEADVMVKHAPDQQIRITVAAIVFAVDPDETETVVENILKALCAK